jgi:multidrug resistance efflux pump
MPLSPVNVSPPEQVINPTIPTPIPLPRRSLRVPVIAAVALLFLGAIAIVIVRRNSSSQQHRVTQNPVTTSRSAGSVVRTVRLTGTTEAVHMRAMVAPTISGEHAATMTVTKLATSGTRVQKDDVLAEFDRQVQMREVIDKQAEYVDLANKTAGAQAKEIGDRAKDETEIGQAESALSKAQLEMQKIELLSKIDVEKAEEALEEAKATLQQLRTTFDLKREAAQAGIHLFEIQCDRAKQVMDHAQANADIMQIRSPIDGIVVLNTIWKEGKMGEVQEGDQLRPGIAFMQVVDPSMMQIRALVNQEDFRVLHMGLPARIHLDAYPELVFRGKLEEMAPIARGGDFSSKLRTFAVVFSIQGNDARLMPDLSAAVDVNPASSNTNSGAY